MFHNRLSEMLIGSSFTFVAAVKLNNSWLCVINKLKTAYD